MLQSIPSLVLEQPFADAMQPVEPINFNIAKLAIGIALSLLLHGMLVVWAWNEALLGAHRAPTEIQPALEVHLLHAAPPSPPPPTPPPESAQPKPTASTAQPGSPSTPKPITITQAAPANAMPAAPESSVTVQPVPGKHIDLETVRSGLGAIVAEVDREQRDTPLGQVQANPQFPPEADNKIAHAVEGGARSDCRDKFANTGLFRPLLMLTTVLDKKDSGCKW